jgi:hypothetical protein
LIVVGEGFDHGVDVAGITLEGDFVEEGDVEDFELFFDEFEDRVFGDGFGEGADELELEAEEFFDFAESPVAVLEVLLIPSHFFDGVVEEGKEGVFFFFGEVVAEDFVDEVAEAAGGVVDDVAEFAVVAVDVADDVDAVFWESELGLEEGEF